MKKLYIHRDVAAPSPRENDNLTWMLVADPGLKHLADGDRVPEDCIASYPLYAYQHGGVVLSVTRLMAQDTSLVGMIYVPEPDFDCTNDGAVTEEEWALDQALAEVEEMNWWLAGECWGYRVADVSVCEQCGAEHESEDSAEWGYIGPIDKCGIKEAVGEELWETREMFEYTAPRTDSRVVTLLRCITTNVHDHCPNTALEYLGTLTRELGIRKDRVFTWE